MGEVTIIEKYYTRTINNYIYLYPLTAALYLNIYIAYTC